MAYTYQWSNPDKLILIRTDSLTGKSISINPVAEDPYYQEFLSSGAVAAPYVAPPEPTPLTTEQKIVAAGFDEGELEDYLVEKIQQRLNE